MLAAAPSSVLPATVSYVSRGRLLIVGEASQVAAALAVLPRGFQTLAVASGEPMPPPPEPTTEVVPGAVVQIEGHLGRFRARAAGPAGALDLGPLSPGRDGLFDLVLDLYPRPLIEFEVAPLGYIRTEGRLDGLTEDFERLRQWIGTVSKPRYYRYDEVACTHDRQGVPGCRRCYTACPAGAIRSLSGRIDVDPYLCQGCGSCALTCPTGALRYAQPSPSLMLERIAETIGAVRTRDDGIGPVLVVHQATGPDAPALRGDVAELRVHRLASVGVEMWLGALALGASRILIGWSRELPPTVARLLVQEVELAQRLLQALGERPERIRLARLPDEADPEGFTNRWQSVPLDALLSLPSKRALLLASLKRLWNGEPAIEDAANPLPKDFPFGDLVIDTVRCTSCFACTQLCPTGALQARDGALLFTEAACVQCGLCSNGCPEQALELLARVPGEPVLTAAVRILKPAPSMFPCVSCGAPFAPRKLVEASIVHVRHHPMFQGEGLRLLQMCMACRQKLTVGLDGKPPSTT